MTERRTMNAHGLPLLAARKMGIRISVLGLIGSTRSRENDAKHLLYSCNGLKYINGSQC